MRREPIVYPEDDYDDERGVFTYTFIANRNSETKSTHVENNDERESYHTLKLHVERHVLPYARIPHEMRYDCIIYSNLAGSCS